MVSTEVTGSEPGKVPRAAVWICNIVLAGWLAYLLIGPTIGFGWIDSWHNEQRAVQVILLLVTAAAFSVLAVLHPAALRMAKGPALLACAFLSLGMVSALQSGHPEAAFAEVSLAVLLVTLAALTAAVTVSAPEMTASWASRFALLYCAAYCLGVAVRLAAAIEMGRGIDLDVLVLGYANPRFASAFHVALIPFVAQIALDRSEAKWLRAIAVAVVTALWGINWGLGTRGIWFAYLLALPALAILTGWSRARPLVALLALTALVGVGCFELLAHVVAPVESIATGLTRPTSNSTLTSREVLWQLSWDAIKGAPLLGIGPMNFAALGNRVGAHPHNWVLQAGAEWGLPATLTLLALAALFIARMRKWKTATGVAISCSILAAVTLALVDGNLVMPITQSAFAIVIGLSVGCARTGDRCKRVAFGLPLAITALAAAICLGTYALSSFSTQESDQLDFQRSHPGVWLLPRFWEHGLF